MGNLRMEDWLRERESEVQAGFAPVCQTTALLRAASWFLPHSPTISPAAGKSSRNLLRTQFEIVLRKPMFVRYTMTPNL